jgi:hypothetical protein
VRFLLPQPALSLDDLVELKKLGVADVPRVPLFYAGRHRDDIGEYTDQDIADILANFKLLSCGPDPKLPVPIGLGHEGEQDWLLSSGLPAAGHIPECWSEDGRSLAVKFADLPEVVADAVDLNAYFSVSPEISRQPPPGLPGKGCCLVGAALLGYKRPELKELGRLPKTERRKQLAELAEKSSGRRTHAEKTARDSVMVFAEAVPAGTDVTPHGPKEQRRQEQVGKLQSWGLSEKTVQILADSLSGANFDKFYTSIAEDLADSALGGNMGQTDDQTKNGQQTQAYAELKPEQLAAIAEQAAATARKQVAEEFAEQRKALDRTLADARAATERAAKEAADREKAEADRLIDEFVESRKRQGKILPYETDDSKPETRHLALQHRLRTLPRERTVECFAEGGAAVKKSALEVAMEEIDSRPPAQFSERVGGQKPGQSNGKALFQSVIEETQKRVAASRATPDIPLHQRLGRPAPRHLR